MFDLPSHSSDHLPADGWASIAKHDLTKVMPAARCRECRRVTWDVSIADGLRDRDKAHAEGCSKPPGRLDLLRSIPLAKQATVLGGRLLHPMSDAEVAAAAKELKWTP
jgi:hypothetical protein